MGTEYRNESEVKLSVVWSRKWRTSSEGGDFSVGVGEITFNEE